MCLNRNSGARKEEVEFAGLGAGQEATDRTPHRVGSLWQFVPFHHTACCKTSSQAARHVH
jgi:hypothetical protein